jgi:lipoic acid synthetase
MVGLGEKPEEIESVMEDLREVGCDFLTIGQYLAPSSSHYPVAEYVHPDQFEEYRRIGYQKGFSFVASAPLVRSSYRAAEMMDHARGTMS